MKPGATRFASSVDASVGPSARVMKQREAELLRAMGKDEAVRDTQRAFTDGNRLGS